MSIVLEFLKGPLQGKAVTIQRSISIGRAGTDISISDPKVSQIHAFIKLDREGRWVLSDNNSRNGILYQGKKVHSLELVPGVEFQIGISLVHCKRIGAITDRKKVSPQQVKSFGKWLKKLSKDTPNAVNVLETVSPQINLRFIEGVQRGTLWEIFYAPRRIGGGALDLCLFEDGMPEDLIAIEAIGKQPYLKTKYTQIVKVNGEPTQKKKLIHGDIIQVGDSKIQIEMVVKET